MPGALCTACAAGRPWSALSGSRRTSFRCNYIMRSSIGRRLDFNRPSVGIELGDLEAANLPLNQIGSQRGLQLSLPFLTLLLVQSVGKDPTLFASILVFELFSKAKSLPIRDEPGGGVSFQYKMSLGRMAC